MKGSRYTAYVAWMRVLLPGAAIALLGLIALWPKLWGARSNLISPSAIGEGVALGEPMVMEGARYVGARDRDSAGYALEAGAATLDPAAPDRIAIEGLSGALEREAGAIELEAGGGVYAREAAELALERGVIVRSQDGYEIQTESATVDVEGGRVRGDREITGSGPLGALRADSFEIEDEGASLRFRGGVRVTIEDPEGKRSPRGAEP